MNSKTAVDTAAAQPSERKVHELKTDPEVYDDVARGAKTCEIRKNDRDFQVGDTLWLRRTASTGEQMRLGLPLVYTGEEQFRHVSHVLTGYGLQEGWCILSFASLPATAQPADAKNLWETIKVLGLSNDRLALQAIIAALAATPAAQPSQESATRLLLECQSAIDWCAEECGYAEGASLANRIEVFLSGAATPVAQPSAEPLTDEQVNGLWARTLAVKSGRPIVQRFARAVESFVHAAPAGAGEPTADFERECADTDQLLTMLGLNPNECCTDGGSLNLSRIRDRLSAGIVTDEMVSRFLGWKLPEHFNPDCGITFDPISSKGTEWESRREPVGTNLLSADQAREMLEYVLGAGAGESAEPSAEPVAQPQKYDDTLLPFLEAMRAELHANSGKGDRPGWLTMSREQGLLEIYWHTAKLSAAVKNNDAALIREHTADVANMAMMLLDVCGGLTVSQAVQPPDPIAAHMNAINASPPEFDAFVNGKTPKWWQQEKLAIALAAFEFGRATPVTAVGGEPSEDHSFLLKRLTAMVSFLCGSGTLDDVDFGEKNPRARGSFWWRTPLRELEKDLAAALAPIPGEPK